jgi:2'-hydroxyisoflavone reductase
MRILFVGGTKFVGRAMVDAALAAGHQVTVLHRGRTGADVAPEATHLLADRDGDLSILAEGGWDATIDVCAYFAHQVRSLAAALDGRGGHYVLISTVSVYADPARPGADESAALLDPDTDDVPTISPGRYGPLKVACEQAAAQVFGEGLTIVRPTFLVGPRDYTGRFPWWVLRLARSGPAVAPGPRDLPMQVIDARDMAEWIIRLAEDRVLGTFTAARPTSTWGELLDTTAGVVGAGAELIWVPADELTDLGATPQDFPLWTVEPAYMLAMATGRAEAAGLVLRPIEQTIADTLAWASQADGPVLTDGVGLSEERDAQLLAALATKRSAG